MSQLKKFGLKLVLWVASVILEEELSPQERENLEHFRTHLSVTNFDEDEL